MRHVSLETTAGYQEVSELAAGSVGVPEQMLGGVTLRRDPFLEQFPPVNREVDLNWGDVPVFTTEVPADLTDAFERAGDGSRFIERVHRARGGEVRTALRVVDGKDVGNGVWQEWHGPNGNRDVLAIPGSVDLEERDILLAGLVDKLLNTRIL